MSEARRSSRIAAQPKKDEPPKPARKPSNKRVSDAAKEPASDGPATKKTRTVAEQPEDATAENANAPETQTFEEHSFNVGDSLPSLTLKNEKGEEVDVSTLAAERGIVLFLIPKADTPGCTTQACGFRDSYPEFTSSNFDVYCVSADSPATQTKWQTKKELPYPLLSDPERKLITALGACEAGKTKRSHFIFEQGGKLIDKKKPVKPVDSPRLALEFIKSIGA